MRIELNWRLRGNEPAPEWPRASAAGAVSMPRGTVAVRPPVSLSFGVMKEALVKALAAETDRWFAWRVVAFAAGIVAYFALAAEPSPELTLGVAATGLAFAILSYRSPGVGFRFLLALVAAAGFGFGAAKLRTALADAPVLTRDLGPVTVEGRVESVDIRAPNRARILLAPTKMGDASAIPRRLRLTLMGAKAVASVQPGARVSALAMLRPPPEPAMPRGYDFARWAYFQGMGGAGFAYGAPKLLEAAPDTLANRFQTMVERLRLSMTARVEAAVPGPDGKIAAALITGERGAIPEDDTDAYRDSGLAHVLSI